MRRDGTSARQLRCTSHLVPSPVLNAAGRPSHQRRAESKCVLLLRTDAPLKTHTPASRKAAAVTPCAAVRRPVNVPSETSLMPQEGLPSFNTATRTPLARAIATAAAAPATNARVRSLPPRPSTRTAPSSTAAPPRAPAISAGSRGVGSPPTTSGQIEQTRPSLIHRIRCALSQTAWPP